ncbi:MAG TPA: ABC transporter permease [Streptosporangiaceae bacterium]|nr:ABC transporter permease [Streptosporangiaceae bacterium]
MSVSDKPMATSAPGSSVPKPPSGSAARGATAWTRFLSPRKIGAVYFLILIVIFFSFLDPNTFPQVETIRSILNEYSISGIMALAVIITLASGLFDLSVGYTMGLAGTLVAWLLANTSMSATEAILLTMATGLVIGLVNALVVVFLRIDSIIATLGTGAIIGAITVGISGNQIIVKNVAGSFSRHIAGLSIGNFTEPVFYMLGLMIIIGLVMEQTSVGRYWYALGFELDVARLAGIRVKLLQTAALLATALVASWAGIALTARIGAASPDAGPSYLLPAFAAAFLGATQFRDGRFNAWGTILATILLGAGQYGILLSGAPVWAPDAFYGVALIGAVAVTSLTGNATSRWRGWPPWMRRFVTAKPPPEPESP